MQPIKFILTRTFAISALLVGGTSHTTLLIPSFLGIDNVAIAASISYAAPLVEKRCTGTCCYLGCTFVDDGGSGDDLVSQSDPF